MDHATMVLVFENAAKKKGYDCARDEVGSYVDNWLQEAWEIFGLMDFEPITDKEG